MARRRKQKKKNNRVGKICISTIVGIFLVVMSMQIFRLYQEDQLYVQKEKSLCAQLDQAKEDQKRLSSYEQYTQSKDYIEDIAKSKLGLVYNNEIVFKEKDK